MTVDYIALTKKKIRNALFNLGFSQFLGTSKDSERCKELGSTCPSQKGL